MQNIFASASHGIKWSLHSYFASYAYELYFGEVPYVAHHLIL